MDATQNPANSIPTTTGESAHSVGDQVLSIIADVEKQLEKLRTAQSGHSEQIITLQQRTKAIEQAEQLVQERMREVETRQQSVSEKAEAVEAERTRLNEQQQELQRARESIEQTRAEVSRDREDLQQLQLLLQEDQNRLAQTKAEIEGRTVQENEELARLRGEHSALAARLEKAEANVGELIQRIETMQEELEKRQQAINQAQREKADVETALQAAREEVAAAKSKAEQAELEGLQLVEQVEAQRNEIAAKLQSAEQARAELSTRVDAATAELGQIRTDLSAKLDSARVESEHLRGLIAEREKALNDANEKLRVAGTKLQQFAEAIAQQSPEMEKGVAAIAECQSLRQTIQRLEQEMKQRGSADGAALNERIEALTQDLADRNTEIENLRVQASQQSAQGGEIEALQAQIQKLTDELRAREQSIETLRAEYQQDVARLEKSVAQAKSAGPDGAGIQEKAKLIHAAAMHLKRRRQRLQRLKGLLKNARPKTKAPTGPDPERARLAIEIQEKKQSLLEVQKCLAASEQQMMRKWARPRAIITMTWMLMLIGGVGIGAWFGAGYWKPPVVAASVVLEAKPKAGQNPTEAELASWQAAHEAMAHDNTFANVVAKRLGVRQIKSLTDSAKVGLFLKENLTVDSDKPGVLRLTLTGTDQPLTLAVLDTVATTMVNESSRSAGKRSDGMKASVTGERPGVGRIEYASINPIPVKDERLMYTGILFGAGVVGLTLIGSVLYTVLMRTKRVFEHDMAVVEDDVTVPIR